MKSSRLATITIKDKQYSYRLRRSRRAKRLLLHVELDGTIEAVIPWYVSYREAQRFVAEKKAWLKRTLVKHHELRSRTPQRELASGEELPFFNETYTLDVIIEPGRKKRLIRDRDNVLYIRVASPSGVRDAVMGWYKHKAKDYFTGQSIGMANKLGVKVQRVAVRDTKTQWGSCNKQKGALTFHWRLALGPENIARYVVAHEVVHLKYANHSDRFWKAVAHLLPSAKHDRRWLRQNSHLLTF